MFFVYFEGKGEEGMNLYPKYMQMFALLLKFS